MRCVGDVALEALEHRSKGSGARGSAEPVLLLFAPGHRRWRCRVHRQVIDAAKLAQDVALEQGVHVEEQGDDGGAAPVEVGALDGQEEAGEFEGLGVGLCATGGLEAREVLRADTLGADLGERAEEGVGARPTGVVAGGGADAVQGLVEGAVGERVGVEDGVGDGESLAVDHVLAQVA